jgi:eukaryotic-like serine/threonine-protein kinase
MHAGDEASSEELATLEVELQGTAYRPIRRIADGGMARVYEVEHRALRRRLVMKLSLEPERAELEDRLRLEAQTLAQLSHPNLLAVTDFGHTASGRAFVTAELLHGRTLARELAERGPMLPARAVALAKQALAGLAAAHRAGVVHRDIKLDNLFLCDASPGAEPSVKVLDFGIAKLLGERGERQVAVDSLELPTADGTVLGTPGFLSPEQVTNQPVDARADLYAMGVVVYSLLTGRPPFAHDDPLETVRAHAFELPPPPSRWVSLPAQLEAVILRALAKRPDERHADAETMSQELQRAMDLSSTGAEPSRRDLPPPRGGAALEPPRTPPPIESPPRPQRSRVQVGPESPSGDSARDPRPAAESPKGDSVELARLQHRARRMEYVAIVVAALSLVAIVVFSWALLARG